MSARFSPDLHGDREEFDTFVNRLKQEGIKAVTNKNFYLVNVVAGCLEKCMEHICDSFQSREIEAAISYFSHVCQCEHNRAAAEGKLISLKSFDSVRERINQKK